MDDFRHLPYLVVSDGQGNVFEIPELRMAAVSHLDPVVPDAAELIALPTGSDLFELPGRVPIGFDPKRREFVEVERYDGRPVFAVAAFMAPAYLHFQRTAYVTQPEAPRLPLYCYTATGWRRGTFYVAATRIDTDQRQDLEHFDLERIARQAAERQRQFAGNRLVQHLMENCVERYGCPAARNAALGRFECPIPTSPGCNAACVGCISEQPDEAGIVSSHDRIRFTPTVDEIVELAVPHLEQAPRPVVSYGQGCEGEPLLAGAVIEAAIRAIRRRTSRGIININTNASRPDIVERLCQAGLDSIRVSLNSAQKNYYEAYYQPRHYRFEDVVESLRVIRRHRRWASINYLVFAGLTDHPDEMRALDALIAEVRLNMIQTRNLNIDPEWYAEELALHELAPAQVGMRSWLSRLREQHPQIKLGYFNPPAEEIQTAAPDVLLIAASS